MENLNLIVVFLEGVLSIFSPCILPILPIYLGMLANSSIDKVNDLDYRNKVLVKNTIFFVLGISVTFFILGSSINILSSFISKYKDMIMLIGGMIIVIMGLFYVGIIKSNLLSQERRFRNNSKVMSPVSSFILGFTFSFGWTPCIGPILASVLIMSSSSQSILQGNLLILVYTLGFILPFVIFSFFYNKLFERLNSLKKYMDLIKKIAGSIIIIAGLVMISTGVMNISKRLDTSSNNNQQVEENNSQEDSDKIKALDFSLYDQYGNIHTLSEYKGKTIFLNFWATWCPPCIHEMPYIEELYQEYNQNKDDVVILGLASPNLGREGDVEHIKNFLKEEGFTFPVVFDGEASMLFNYGINSFPATFIIDKDGYIVKYVRGAMSKETMKNLIEDNK